MFLFVFTLNERQDYKQEQLNTIRSVYNQHVITAIEIGNIGMFVIDFGNILMYSYTLQQASWCQAVVFNVKFK